MAHNDKRFLGLQVAAGFARRNACAYRPATDTIQSGHSAELTTGGGHEDGPTFTPEKTARAQAAVKAWVKQHYGQFDAEVVDAAIAKQKPFEI